MRILHSVAVPERAVAADIVEVDDLAVNALSVVLIAIRPLNNTATLANFARYLDVVGSLNRVSILHQGTSIVNASGRDIAALNYFRHGITPMEANPDDVDNDRRCVILPVLLGRFAYDPVSAFPPSRRGELTLELDIDAADTGYDGFRFSVETIELLDVKPTSWERKTTISQTFGATGDNDINLPLGRKVRGILAFGTTGFAGAAPVPSLGRMSLFLDNREMAYTATDFEVAQCLGQLMGRQPPLLDQHTHRVDATGGTTQETAGPIEQGSGGWNNYCYLDLDPTRDDRYSLDTKGVSDFFLRVNAETADAVRIIPVERAM